MDIQTQKAILICPTDIYDLATEWRVALESLVDLGKVEVSVHGFPMWADTKEYIAKDVGKKK